MIRTFVFPLNQAAITGTDLLTAYGVTDLRISVDTQAAKELQTQTLELELVSNTIALIGGVVHIEALSNGRVVTLPSHITESATAAMTLSNGWVRVRIGGWMVPLRSKDLYKAMPTPVELLDALRQQMLASQTPTQENLGGMDWVQLGAMIESMQGYQAAGELRV